MLFHSPVSRSSELSKLDGGYESPGALLKSDYESASLGCGWVLHFQQAPRKCQDHWSLTWLSLARPNGTQPNNVTQKWLSPPQPGKEVREEAQKIEVPIWIMQKIGTQQSPAECGGPGVLMHTTLPRLGRIRIKAIFCYTTCLRPAWPT